MHTLAIPDKGVACPVLETGSCRTPIRQPWGAGGCGYARTPTTHNR